MNLAAAFGKKPDFWLTEAQCFPCFVEEPKAV